jgi:hypothetical protein
MSHRHPPTLFFETSSHYVAQAGLELWILLPLSPQFWDLTASASQ